MSFKFGVHLASAMLLFIATVQAQFTFTTNNGTLTITGFSGAGTVIIPPSTNGRPIVGIGAMGFQGSQATSVAIPSSITNFGTRIFNDCSFLTNLTVNSSVIGNGAFAGIQNLTTLSLGKGVTNIGNGAFQGCTKLTGLQLPATVVNIGQSAFQSCTGLISVSIAGKASIGNMAFYQCTNLTDLDIATGVPSIGTNAFAYCSSLRNVIIPSSVTNIGINPFGACAKLVAINVDTQNGFYTSVDGVLFDKVMTTLLQYPAGLSNAYTLPDNVTTIGFEAFLGAHVTRVALPQGLANIGGDAFLDCGSLSSIQIPAGVVNISGDAFADCFSLTNVTLSAGLSGIGSVAFFQCTALQNITIPGSVTNIGNGAFSVCYRLANIFFGGNAPVTDPAAFSQDAAATVYYLPGTTGWSSNFAGLPAVLWNPAMQNATVTNNQFGFEIIGTSNIPIVLQASANLGGPWQSLQSLDLTNGSVFFSEPVQANTVGRFYRITAP